MPSPESPPLAFDGFVIDFAGRRLLRAGEPLPLEPKAFSVLALLARAPGQALTRDEILDAVWGHRHVTPGVLNRIMTLLRHALGEEAQAPRYLHTLHGVGYRFDLPLSTLPAEVAEDSAPTPTALALDAEDAPSSSAPISTARRRSPWLAVAAVGVLGVLAGLGWWVWRSAEAPAVPSAAVPAAAMPTLIVMPLKPIGGDAADRDIAAGLSDELISALARIQGLRVIARESTGLAASQSAAIASLVPKLGISHALEGSLRQSGEQLRIHLRLNDARSGRTLWAQDYDRNASDILALQREVAHAVATALTLKLGLPSTPAGKSGDAAFLRRYFAAKELLNTPNIGGNAVERAESEFRQLIRLRPDDARAHAALAVALEMRAFSRPPLAEGLRAEAAQEAALAQGLDPSLADTYRVQAWAACRGNRWEDCIGLSRKSSESGSSDSQPFLQYAMALAALGYLDRAEAVLRANIERDPINPAWHFGYGRMLDTLGRHQDARAQLELGRPFSPYSRWFNAVWRRDYAEALDIAESMGKTVNSPDYERLFKPSYVVTSHALRDPSR